MVELNYLQKIGQYIFQELLNTSFNLAGEPLVETPEDAFNTLNNSRLNYLWFEETQQLFKNKKSVSIGYQ
jgi:predicted NodU family carbamoyl transferase